MYLSPRNLFFFSRIFITTTQELGKHSWNRPILYYLHTFSLFSSPLHVRLISVPYFSKFNRRSARTGTSCMKSSNPQPYTWKWSQSRLYTKQSTYVLTIWTWQNIRRDAQNGHPEVYKGTSMTWNEQKSKEDMDRQATLLHLSENREWVTARAIWRRETEWLRKADGEKKFGSNFWHWHFYSILRTGLIPHDIHVNCLEQVAN